MMRMSCGQSSDRALPPTSRSFPPWAGWWCWADAYVYQHAVQGSAYPFKYNWPGIVATIALVLINALPRRDLKELSESGEEGEAVRGHLWLLVSLLLAFGAVAGSVSVLVHCSQTDLVSVGVVSVVLFMGVR